MGAERWVQRKGEDEGDGTKKEERAAYRRSSEDFTVYTATCLVPRHVTV